MKLVYDATGEEVMVGDTITVGGDTMTITEIVKPKSPQSTGRVYVTSDPDEDGVGYYPSVINAHWIEREDQ